MMMEILQGSLLNWFFILAGLVTMGMGLAVAFFGVIYITWGAIPWLGEVHWRNLEDKDSLEDYALDTKRPLWKVTQIQSLNYEII